MQHVEIRFDCLPLRSVGRLDVPLDASPVFRAQCERIKAAIEKHGAHNSYYLSSGRATYRLTNDPQVGLLAFEFEGTVLTDASDLATRGVDLAVELAGESCDWLTKPTAEWFAETVQRAVAVEFDRYIAAGDLKRTVERVQRIGQLAEESGGYIGMYL
jgi:hypothetical protein